MNAPVVPETLTVLRSRSQPLATPLMAKVGCTFLRNLVYLLDNDRLHHDPVLIHQDPTLQYVALGAEDFADLVSFFVVRNPQDRFFSLYWDKAWGGSTNPFPWLIDRLEIIGFDRRADLTAKQHRVNCNRLLGFLERQFRNKGSHRVNVHWMPQAHRAETAARLGLQPVVLDQIGTQLPVIADNRVPGIEEAMTQVGRANASPRPFSNAELIDDRLVQRIHELYAGDFDLVAQVRERWDAS